MSTCPCSWITSAWTTPTSSMTSPTPIRFWRTGSSTRLPTTAPSTSCTNTNPISPPRARTKPPRSSSWTPSLWAAAATAAFQAGAAGRQRPLERCRRSSLGCASTTGTQRRWRKTCGKSGQPLRLPRPDAREFTVLARMLSLRKHPSQCQ